MFILLNNLKNHNILTFLSSLLRASFSTAFKGIVVCVQVKYRCISHLFPVLTCPVRQTPFPECSVLCVACWEAKKFTKVPAVTLLLLCQSRLIDITTLDARI